MFARVILKASHKNTPVGFIQACLCKIQGLLKNSPMVFKDYKFLKILNFTLEMVAEILENLA